MFLLDKECTHLRSVLSRESLNDKAHFSYFHRQVEVLALSDRHLSQTWAWILAQTTLTVCPWTTRFNSGTNFKGLRWGWNEMTHRGTNNNSCAMQCAKHFQFIVTLNPHHSPRRSILLFPPLSEEETEAQMTDWDMVRSYYIYYFCWYAWKTYMYYLTKNILRVNQRYTDPGTRLNTWHDFLN